MKKLIRTLSLMVCMALLMTTVPVEFCSSAYAREAADEALELEALTVEAPAVEAEPTSEPEKQPENTATEQPAQTPEAAPLETEAPQTDADADAEPTADMTAQATPAPISEEEQKPSVDYTTHAGMSPSFVLGYAQIISEAALYVDCNSSAEKVAVMGKNGVVYALERNSECDRLKVVFNAGETVGLEMGWMDAEKLRPIEPVEEAADYVRFCAGEENVLYYNTLPLNAIVYSYVEVSPTQTPVPAASNVPAASEEPVVTEAPLTTEEPVVTEAPLTTEEPIASDAPAETQEPSDEEDETDDGLYFVDEPSDGLISLEQLQVAFSLQRVQGDAVDETNETNEAQSGNDMQPVGAVLLDATAVSFNHENLNLAVGATIELATGNYIKLEPEGASATLTYTSSNPEIVSVDATGKLNALKAGTASLTVKTENELSASINVTVTEKLASVSFSEGDMLLLLGDSYDMSTLVQLNPQDAANDLAYSTDHPEVLTVDAKTGVAKALAVGTANVIASSASDATITASCAITVVEEAQNISFTETGLPMGVGNTFDLKTLLKTEPEGSVASYSFKSNNAKYVSVTADGVVKGVKAGKTVTITATSHNGKQATIKVRAYKAPSKISLSPASYTLGEEQTGRVSVSFPKNCYSLYAIESSAPEIVSVDANGNLVGKSAGTATITVTTMNGKRASATVTVLKAPDAISASRETYNMGVGMTSKDVYGVCPENTLCAFEYASSDAKIVEVNAATGEMIAKAVGTATITITSKNSKKATAVCTVNVEPAPEKIQFSESGLMLGIGNSYDLKKLMQVTPDNTNASYSFKSNNAKYVSVTADGVVKGVKAGKTVTITATSHNGKQATIKVRAYKAPNKISLSPASYTLGEEQTGRVSVSFPKNCYSLYTIESSAPEIVSVDANGNLVGKSAGTATITVTTMNGKRASATVTVLKAPDTISASRETYNMGVGMTSRDVYGVCPENTLCAFEYVSSDAKIVEVNAATGEMIAKAVGTATITITSKNSKKATAVCTVNVEPAPEKIQFSESGLMLGIGNSYDLKKLMQVTPDNTNASYSFKSNNAKYVSVTADGVVKGVKAGKTVTITATSHNGKQATIKVRAYKAPNKISLSPASYTLGEEQTGRVSVSFPKNCYSLYTIESSAPEIVSVDANGNLVGKSAGAATITVTTMNGKRASATVTVLKAPDTISASRETYNMGVGMTSKDVYGVCPENTLCAFEYVSSDAKIVEVNAATGEMIAKAVGTATIMITSKNSKKATAVCTVNVEPAPEKIQFSESGLMLGIGNSYDLKKLMQVTPDNTNASYSFKSNNAKYVSVTADGVVKGVKAGKTVTITATSHNGKQATIKVRAYKAPNKISLSPASYTLGEEQTGRVSVSFPKNCYSLYTIESSAPEIVSVDANGNLVGKSAGTATITVTTMNGKRASATVTVLKAPDTISASRETYNMGVGMTSKDVYGVCPENTLCAFEYASSDAKIVEVNAATGEMIAKAVGTATITITSKNSKKATAVCTVNVEPAPEKIQFSESGLMLGIGNSYDLKKLMQVTPDNTNASYSFKSNNAKYVSVTADGVVKGVKAGKTVTITATSHNGKQATIKVRAYKAPSKISLTPASLELGVGMTTDLKVSFPKNTYSLYSLTSSDESIVSVNENGTVTALKAGSATITAKTLNGRSDSCIVTVKNAPTFVEFLYDEIEISEGMKQELDPIIDQNALAKFSFASSNNAVATVDANGVVTGVKSGTAKISVTTHNGISNQYECTVSVKPAPQRLDYNDMPTLVIARGDTVEIPEPIAVDASGNECAANFTFKSSNSKYAKVSGDKVTGVKAGTVVITATSHNGKTASFKLQVVNKSILALELSHTSATLWTNDDYIDVLYIGPSFASADGSINYGSVSYVSSNPEVAFVSEDGYVAALAPGNAVITAKTYNGLTASCTITVKKLTSTLSFKEQNLTMTEGKQAFAILVADANSDGYGSVSFASSNTSIASINEDGYITAHKSGDVTITATLVNDLTAQMQLHVIAGPTAVSLNVNRMELYAGEEFTFDASLSADSAEFDASLLYVTSDGSVATVDPTTGKVTAVKPGKATITVTTCNNLSASCEVVVLAEGSVSHAGFAWESATMVKGDTASLAFSLNAQAYKRGFTIASEQPDVLSVSEDGKRITAKAAAPDGVKLTMTINSAEGEELATLPEEISCTIYILEKTQAAFSTSLLELSCYENGNYDVSTGEVKLTGLPDNLIGTYAFYVEDESLIDYDFETGKVQASSENYGETKIICQTYDRSIECVVKVKDLVHYRAVVISEYNNSTETGSNLPFAQRNTVAVNGILQQAQINGRGYASSDITLLNNNPTQAQMASAIATTFADAKDDDVSFIYILAHGYNGRKDINNGGYFFGTPHWSSTKPDSYITSSELMSWLKPIKGNVVLVLVTCKSGGFINDQRSALAAEGNIAVITAQTSTKNASYYLRASDGYSAEYATYAFCEAMGHDYNNPSKLSAAAGADSNGDGLVTVSELFSFMQSETSSLVVTSASKYYKAGGKTGFLVPGVKNKKDLLAWGGQEPQVFIPDSLKNVVVYGRN